MVRVLKVEMARTADGLNELAGAGGGENQQCFLAEGVSTLREVKSLTKVETLENKLFSDRNREFCFRGEPLIL